jgi:D-alanine-D-alanine ligase
VEHEVSIITAVQLMKQVDTKRFTVVPLYVDKAGRWWTGEILKSMEFYQNLDLQNPQDERLEPVEFSADPTQAHPADVIMLCTHGGHGEDGTMAGLLELANIPYAAPGVVAAGLFIDKIATKHILQALNIPITNYVWFFATAWQTQQSDILTKVQALRGPWFVKPATLGSSVGVTRVETKEELVAAIDQAAHFDRRIIVEEAALDCIEVNISVIGAAENPQVSINEQPKHQDAFLSYADKYERGGKKSGGMAGLSRQIPAPISPELTAKLNQAAKTIWQEMDGSGVARIDFLANPSTEEFFVTEVNAPPGSMAFYLWEASGKSYQQLINELIDVALERQEQKQQLLHSIQSNILQKK